MKSIVLLAVILLLGTVAAQPHDLEEELYKEISERVAEGPQNLDQKIGALYQLRKDQNRFNSLVVRSDIDEYKWRLALKTAALDVAKIASTIDNSTYWKDIKTSFMEAYGRFNLAYQAWLRYDFLDLHYNQIEKYYDGEEESFEDLVLNFAKKIREELGAAEDEAEEAADAAEEQAEEAALAKEDAAEEAADGL
eukprot:TRINITY_DN483_c0_g3_i1.p2 TRINITY_DN483_c0_g3~~TRINITY_DN483_c0_g3_i1.p2  ORF type:complete len:194 (-),score=94.26 TRINITY_DN483_c0_g3_i1:221-802(-)